MPLLTYILCHFFASLDAKLALGCSKAWDNLFLRSYSDTKNAANVGFPYTDGDFSVRLSTDYYCFLLN